MNRHDYKNIMITGGAGFIGSNFIHYLLKKTDFTGRIINVDILTYAGNLANLTEIERNFENNRYLFEKVDIRDFKTLKHIFGQYEIDAVCHFAAESHVDRSISGPQDFIETNIVGTFNLLEIARTTWGNKHNCRFHHVSTDEVYGSLGATGLFHETTPYAPRSPYSASKASSDHLVRAYQHTYGLPVSISNCSNNYGPYQFPEKLIPVMILNAIAGKPLPVYGDGKNVRDWLYVEDHCSAIWEILTSGRIGETYNVGGECEKCNIDLVNSICSILQELRPVTDGTKPYKELISYVKDRPGHDRRYAICCEKIKKELRWQPQFSFECGLRDTVAWYLEHQTWIEEALSNY